MLYDDVFLCYIMYYYTISNVKFYLGHHVTNLDYIFVIDRIIIFLTNVKVYCGSLC
jgi:hypothetical protein